MNYNKKYCFDNKKNKIYKVNFIIFPIFINKKKNNNFR